MNILNNLPLGSIISFRYNDPKKRGFNMPKNVLVLTSNFQGHLHGIKITGLTVVEQEYLQQLFRVAYGNPTNIFEPMEAAIQQRKKEIDVLNNQRKEMVKSGQRVIMTPQPPPNPTFGIIDKAKQAYERTKQVLGSVVGKVSTFGRTNVQSRPANQNLQQELIKQDQIIKQKQAELTNYTNYFQQQKQNIEKIPRISTDPYQFYHMFLKSFIGNPKRMKNIYRKYNLARVQTPRIIKTAGIIPNVR